MKITDKKIELLKMVGEFKFLPVRLLIEILLVKKVFSNWQYVYLVISKLEKEGLLKSSSLGYSSKLVFLSNKGASLFGTKANFDYTVDAPKQNQIWRIANIEHSASIAEIYLSLLKEEVKILNWFGDHQVSFNYTYRSNSTGKKVRKNLMPDSFFVLEKGNMEIPYFLEYDTGTMQRQQLAVKFTRYFEYFAYSDWRERYEQFPNLLFLTERSEKSMKGMIEAQVPGVDDLLRNRAKLKQSQNILIRGIGLSENINSINSKFIREFLELKFHFNFKNDQWQKEFLELA
jgi:hypothetical protein